MNLRKSIISVIILCTVVCGFVVFAKANYKQDTKEANILGDKNEQILLSEDDSVNIVINDTEILQCLEKQNLDDDEIQYSMEKLFQTMLLYPVTNYDLSTIEKMVSEGADISKIIDIYVFLQDSNASLEYLKDMYYIGEKVSFFGKYWIEDAFNNCSGQDKNELSMAQIKEYVDNGVDTNDIRIANIVSRSEEKTIKEIIDEKQQNKSWGEIINESYSDVDLSGMTEEQDGTVVLDCVRLSKMSNEPTQQIYQEYKKDPQDTTSKIALPKLKKADEYIKQFNLNVTDKKEYIENLKKTTKDKVSEEDLTHFISNQYTEKQIKKAIKVAEKEGRTVKEVLEENAVMNNLDEKAKEDADHE